MARAEVTGAGKLPRRTLVDDAREAILKLILEGKVKPGEHLVERRLAEEFGTSRGPVRDALLRLAEEGLIVESGFRRTVALREFGAQYIIDLYNVRVAIESVALRLAVRRGASADELEKIHGQMVDAAREEDVLRVAELDLRFHRELCALAGNPHIDRIMDGLSTQMHVAFVVDSTYYVPRRDLLATIEEHRPIIEAVRTGDEARGIAALLAHIEGFEGDAHTHGQLGIPLAGIGA
jgi:DNA-binding GntR family transcriptional regulator